MNTNLKQYAKLHKELQKLGYKRSNAYNEICRDAARVRVQRAYVNAIRGNYDD